MANEEWGPLGRLIGDWEGTGGLDRAFSHGKRDVIETPYLEKLSFKPFGPVQNGRQVLYGLDYRTAMWRGNEENPFHTEVGYWLWDAAAGEVLRGFTYLAANASTVGYEATITIHDDPSWSYAEVAMLVMKELPEPLAHSDHNTLRRVS